MKPSELSPWASGGKAANWGAAAWCAEAVGPQHETIGETLRCESCLSIFVQLPSVYSCSHFWGLHEAQLPLEAQLHCALKPSGPQHEERGTLFPAAFLADQLHTLLMDLNLPLGSSSCKHAKTSSHCTLFCFPSRHTAL